MCLQANLKLSALPRASIGDDPTDGVVEHCTKFGIILEAFGSLSRLRWSTFSG
jgi:hypothetical protein